LPVDITKILCGLLKTTKEKMLDLKFTAIFLSVGKHNYKNPQYSSFL